MQYSTSTTFSDLNTIKARIVESVDEFVFAFDTNDTTYGDNPDRWWCSALGDYTDWTPNVDTGCVTGQFKDTPGGITAGKAFGNQIVVYKSKAMYIGSYTGTPYSWTFERIPGDIGTYGQESVINIGSTSTPIHMFMGENDFFIYDGGQPRPIGAPVRETVFGKLLREKSAFITTLHDRANGLVYFYFPVSDSINPDHCVVYNYKTDKWGVDDQQVEATFMYTDASLTWDDIGNVYSTWDDITGASWNTQFISAGNPVIAIIGTDHIIYKLTGTSDSTQASLISGDIGDDQYFSLLSRVRPRFLQSPTSGSSSLTNYYRDNPGDTLTADPTVIISNNKFDFMREARWHRFAITLNGQWEVSGLDITAIKTSYE